MKNLVRFAFVLLIGLGGFACKGPEGPEGPPGPEGVQGPAGVNAGKARVLEFEGALNATNDYTTGIEFAQNNIQVGSKDVIMAYLLLDVERDNNNNPVLEEGEPIGIWMPLPQTLNANAGPVKFNYYHSKNFVAIYLDATQQVLSTLPANFARAFRVVILPGSETGARMANGAKAKHPVDLNDYAAVAKYYNISEADVVKLKK